MRLLKKGLLALLIMFLIVFLVCVIRALQLVPTSPTSEGQTVETTIKLDQAMVDRLSAAIQIPTVWEIDNSQMAENFLRFRRFLRESYSNIHRQLERQILSNYSLLYKWEGSDPSLDADLFVTHSDVAPVAEEEIGSWTQPPFSGDVSDGYIWGRGTLDNKGPMLALLEAVEQRIAEGYRPRRTIYIAVGHDEEVGGLQGALAISRFLRQSDVKLRSVFDEGGFLTHGVVPHVSRPVALIGVAEKGYLTLELSVEVEGGHSSAPQGPSAIARLSLAIARIESSSLPPRLTPVVEDTLKRLAPEMSLAPRIAAANLWLFRPLILQWFASTTASPLVRTTTAITVFHAGQRENVLPSKARALVNFRLLPGDGREMVIGHARTVIDDPSVRIQVHSKDGVESYFPATPASPLFGNSVDALRQSVSEVFPGAVTVTTLNVGATDSRHFLPLTERVYRFAPLRVRREDIRRLHGIDERISLSNYLEAIHFYYRFLKNLDSFGSGDH